MFELEQLAQTQHEHAHAHDILYHFKLGGDLYLFMTYVDAFWNKEKNTIEVVEPARLILTLGQM
jgi:hypothetical protein